MPLRVVHQLHPGLPLARESGGRAFTLERRFHDRLSLRSGSALPPEDRGAYGQRRLRAWYGGLVGRELRDTVLYSSFDGRQYSDSPRAVHEELARRGTGVEHLWVVRDQQAVVPPGTRAVALHSAEWYEALARSRWVVTNTQLPEWFERAEGQFVVQTWHGTPLKRIGRDLAGTPHADTAYMESMPHRAAQWSVLVSPNRFSTPSCAAPSGTRARCWSAATPATTCCTRPTGRRSPPPSGSGSVSRRASGSSCTPPPGARTGPSRAGCTGWTSSSTWNRRGRCSVTTTSCWCAATTWSAAASLRATSSATCPGTPMSPS